MRNMLGSLRQALKKKPVLRHADRHAGVACILRGSPEDLEMLFILRATNPGDRWSGQVAFPGGKKDEEDVDIKATAEREVWEEIGLQLGEGYEYLGRIDDRSAGKNLSVACMVYYQVGERTPELKLNDSEISAVGWAKVVDMERDKSKSKVRWPEPVKPTDPPKPFIEKKLWFALGIFGIDHVAFPAIDLPLTQRTNAPTTTEDYGFRLWGLTLWMAAQVVARTGGKSTLFAPLPGFTYEGPLAAFNNGFISLSIAITTFLNMNFNWYNHLQIHAVFALLSLTVTTGAVVYKVSRL